MQQIKKKILILAIILIISSIFSGINIEAVSQIMPILKVGETLQLVATVNPSAGNKTITWDSSRKDVATVDRNGLVKGVGGGRTMITAKSSNNEILISREVEVVVPTISVTSVKINGDNLMVVKGTKSKTMLATVYPTNVNKTVTWGTSNSSIATVSGGVATGIKEGVIEMTATAGGETGECTTIVYTPLATEKEAIIKSATIRKDVPSTAYEQKDVVAISTGTKIILKGTINDWYFVAIPNVCSTFVHSQYIDSNIPVTSVTAGGETSTIYIGQTKKLGVTVYPSNATNQTLSWSSSKPSVASVDANGNIKGVSEGLATITVTSQDGKKSDSCVYGVYKYSTGTGKVTGTGVSVRELPSTSYKVQQVAKNGETLKILGVSNDWYFAIFENQSSGFISKQYVTTSSSTTPNNPPVSSTGISLTVKQMTDIGWTGASQAMVDDLNRVLKKYNIQTKEQVRHFLSQCMIETGCGKSLLEGYYTVYTYDYCKKNYPNIPETKKGKYGGSGYIQLTGSGKNGDGVFTSPDDTYTKLSALMGDNNIKTIGARCVAANYSWEAAGFYWTGAGYGSKYSINNKITEWSNQGYDWQTISYKARRKVKAGLFSDESPGYDGYNTAYGYYKDVIAVIK